jgi:hypothetical protein
MWRTGHDNGPMRSTIRFLAVLAVAMITIAAGTLDAYGARKTVCTITVNSPDEKEMMRKRLPRGEYDFVELVEKGREDWLRSSCSRGVQCDALVISGHFNAGETFYSDRLDVDHHLAIDELERASCSGNCPGIFAKLKEVYLFGCESLNPDASKYASAYGESGKSRMRRIFSNVPVIYGFSSSAPVGPTAAMLLERHFNAGASRIGTGQVSSNLLRAFSRNSMTTARGVGNTGPEAEERARICTFFDERQSIAQRLAFSHEALRADPDDARDMLPRIEKLARGLDAATRETPEVRRTLAEIARDEATRDAYLRQARSQRDLAERARRISVAADLGWLDAAQRDAERVALVDAMLVRDRLGFAEVDLACTLNQGNVLSAHRGRLRTPARAGTGHAAVLACYGDSEGHAQVIRALSSSRDDDVQVAQAYLRHRPLDDPRQLRAVASDITRNPSADAQVRGLDAIAPLRISDREILDELARAFAQSRSVNVQRAIAGVLIRADGRPAGIADVVRRHRLDVPGRGGAIDALAATQ